MGTITIEYPNNVTPVWDPVTKRLDLSNGTTGPNPNGNLIPPVNPGAPTPTQVKRFAYPINGQLDPKLTVEISGPSWVQISTQIPVQITSPKPNNLGFAKIAMITGVNNFVRDVLVWRDGIKVYDNTGQEDFEPSILFCNNNPTGFRHAGASFNNMPGQFLDFYIRSPRAVSGERCSFFFEFAAPERIR